MAECSGPDRHRDRGGSCSFTNNPAGKSQGAPGTTVGAGEYCRKVQEWLWQYYSYVQWQSWLMMMAPLPPYYPFVSGGARQSEGEAAAAPTPGVNSPFPLYPPYLGVPTVSPAPGEQPQQREVATASASGVRLPATNAQQQAANVHPRGREYTIPSLMHRFLAEMVDFLILFLLKAIVVLTVMHICGIKDLSKFALNYIIEEIDEDTSLEDLQKMMAVALMYRLLVCFYEIVCLWGVGGATPGKFLLGLRVVSCDSSVLVAPNRVLVIPAQNVSISSLRYSSWDHCGKEKWRKIKTLQVTIIFLLCSSHLLSSALFRRRRKDPSLSSLQSNGFFEN
ncbi:protein FAM8A1-like isoform X1 [Hemiscyllium ocellatum]|uniref:protein FAM8A1-like isoform X1 n=1 Tax=Hemiscyllium ocellatum TaxID=170820 RepID=UPI0029660FD9|nr:protein FAM8A1-like isoform X1 [Hemiscyllium ocellatum]